MATTPKKKPPAKKAPAKKAAAKKARVKKAPSGTLTERMGEVKNRPNKGLPARIERSRGNLNRATTPNEIRLKGEGGTGRSLTRGNLPANFKPVPLGDRPKLLGNASAVARTGARVGLTRAVQMATGPVGFLVGMTTEAGAGSDSPPKYGRTLREQAEQRKKQAFGTGGGNPKTVNPYKAPKSKQYPGAFMSGGYLGGLFKPQRSERNADMSKTKIPARGEARGGMKSTLESYRESKVVKPSISMAGGDVNKPESTAAAPKPKARPARSAAVAPKPKARPSVAPAKGMTFQTAVRRNETESYTRNKMKPKGNLLDLIRRKK